MFNRLIFISLLFFLPAIDFAFDINPFKEYNGGTELVQTFEQTAAGIVVSSIINPVHEELTIKTLFFVRNGLYVVKAIWTYVCLN